MEQDISIRQLNSKDCPLLHRSFAEQGWNKSLELFENYLAQQARGERTILVATFQTELAGYLTMLWRSEYPPFRELGIPEICDLNTLIKFRKKGVATALMDAAENEIAQRSGIVGIGVGLTADYGAAQQMYVRRGYVPDGNGISKKGMLLEYGDEVTVDDDLTLWLTKQWLL
jgi:GNAT superfamily N-acetyltransferase